MGMPSQMRNRLSSLTRKYIGFNEGVSPSADGDQFAQLDRASCSQLDRIDQPASPAKKLPHSCDSSFSMIPEHSAYRVTFSLR